MSAVCPLSFFALFVANSFPLFGVPRRVFAPAGRPTFFAGAKKVGKETPNTSLFERIGFNHLGRLRRMVRLGATSIHGDVKGLVFQQCQASTFSAVIPAFAGVTATGIQLPPEVVFRRDQPKTLPERQWPLAESSLHLCDPAPSHHSRNRLVFRCFVGDFFCTSKRSYSAAGPRPGAVHGKPVSMTKAAQEELNDAV